MISLSKTFLLTTAVVACCSFFSVDDCGVYITQRKGAVLEYKTYDDKSKITGTIKNTVTDIRSTATGQEFEIKAESFNKNDESTGTTAYVQYCENGNFMIDMRSLVLGEHFKNTDAKMEGDKLNIPANPTEGQILNDGSFSMAGEADGSTLKMKLTMIVSNRKVDALEDVTIPMGSFPCVKISYDLESKMAINVKTKVIEWYSINVGLIKRENYNNQGKLIGSTVLQSRGMAR
jgi:hypothetical protein